MGVKSNFNDWLLRKTKGKEGKLIKGRFIENTDFVSISEKSEKPQECKGDNIMGGYLGEKGRDILVHVIDLNGGKTVFRKDGQQMRPSFKLHELVCDCCNTTIINNKQLDLIQAIRDYLGYGIKVNSHYRCRNYNNKVDGYKFSCHMKGTASDLAINPNDLSKEELDNLIKHAVKNGAKEVGVYYKHNFIHFAVESTSTRTNREYNGIKYRLFEVR